MDNKEKEFLFIHFSKRLNEFSKIADFKDQPIDTIKKEYKSIDEFIKKYLNIDQEILNGFREKYSYIESFYQKRGNKRKAFFSDMEKFIEWYNEQNGKCYYCKTTQKQLYDLVKKRNGNLTLNSGDKRYSGTLEIEKLDSNKDYTLDNCVIACPLCNNAKSNLISDIDWLEYFAKPMELYIQDKLK